MIEFANRDRKRESLVTVLSEPPSNDSYNLPGSCRNQRSARIARINCRIRLNTPNAIDFPNRAYDPSCNRGLQAPRTPDRIHLVTNDYVRPQFSEMELTDPDFDES